MWVAGDSTLYASIRTLKEHGCFLKSVEKECAFGLHRSPMEKFTTSAMRKLHSRKPLSLGQ